MKQHVSLLLETWREACRQLEPGESLRGIAALLLQRLPISTVQVLRLDLRRPALVTLQKPGKQIKANEILPALNPEQCTRLLRWCRMGQALSGDLLEVSRQLPELPRETATGSLWIGPLQHNDQPSGILILAGADHPWPNINSELLHALLEPCAVAMSNDRHQQELRQLREALEADKRSLLSRLDRQDISESIIGAETGLRLVVERIDMVSPADAPVLLLGETGSGKEVVAREIHTRSRRANGPFLRVNCAAVPAELLDSQLFGHERGSFTGAAETRKGWFERADGGTLFLDEIGDMPLHAQMRLLRILQDGEFERVGGQRLHKVDVRVIAATHQNLQHMVSAGTFREDLWYRIAVFPIQIPPLRARLEDIPVLAAHFALRAAKRLGTPSLVPTPEETRLLINYPWPGNVRELAAVIERAAILGHGRRLEIDKALGVGRLNPPSVATSPREPTASDRPARPEDYKTLDEVAISHIEETLSRTNGRIEGPHGAARLLGINPHTLRARMRRLGIAWQGFRFPLS